jgi:hypothetical protein
MSDQVLVGFGVGVLIVVAFTLRRMVLLTPRECADGDFLCRRLEVARRSPKLIDFGTAQLFAGTGGRVSQINQDGEDCCYLRKDGARIATPVSVSLGAAGEYKQELNKKSRPCEA